MSLEAIFVPTGCGADFFVSTTVAMATDRLRMAPFLNRVEAPLPLPNRLRSANDGARKPRLQYS